MKRYATLVVFNKKADCNTRNTEIENKIPSNTCLVTTTAVDKRVTETENKALNKYH